MRTEKRLWQTDPFCPTSSTEIHTIFGHPCTTIPTLVLVLRGHWLVGRNIEFYHFVALHLWHLIGQQLFMYVELVFVVFFCLWLQVLYNSLLVFDSDREIRDGRHGEDVARWSF